MHRAPSEVDSSSENQQAKDKLKRQSVGQSSDDRSSRTFSHAHRPRSILSLAHYHTGMMAQHNLYGAQCIYLSAVLVVW